MGFFDGLEKFERFGLSFFTLFVFLQCISNAAANIALGFSVFCLLLHLATHFTEINFEQAKKVWDEDKGLILSFCFFWIVIFLSAIFSDDVLKGLKIFFGQFVYRTVPLFIILFFFRQVRFVKLFLFLCLISCSIDVIGSLYLQGVGPRLQGFFGSPMTLAGFLVMTIPILFCSLLNWDQKKISLFVGSILFVITSIGLLLNSTRGAWLAVAITLPLIAIIYDRSLKKILFLIIIATSVSVVFLNTPHLLKRAESITSTTFQSNTERLLMWESAFKMFKDHPALGVGIGQYAPKYLNKYRSIEAKEFQTHCHNNFLQILAESGIIGFIGFISLFGYILTHSIAIFCKSHSPFALLIFGVTISLMLQGMTEYNFGNSAVIKYYWTVLGCLLVFTRNRYDLRYLFTFGRARAEQS